MVIMVIMIKHADVPSPRLTFVAFQAPFSLLPLLVGALNAGLS